MIDLRPAGVGLMALPLSLLDESLRKRSPENGMFGSIDSWPRPKAAALVAALVTIKENLSTN